MGKHTTFHLINKKDLAAQPQGHSISHYCTEGLDPVPQEEVVHNESHPAESEDSDGKEDFADNAKAGLLEDVEYAPDGDYDTEDINNLS